MSAAAPGRPGLARSSGEGPEVRDDLERAHHAAVARLAMLALCHQTSFTELVRRSLRELLELVPADAAAVLLVEGDEAEVHLATEPSTEGARFSLEGSLCEVALRTGELVRADDPGQDPLVQAAGWVGATGRVWIEPISTASPSRILVCLGRPGVDGSPVADASIEAIANILAAAAERHTIDAEVRATEHRFRRLAQNVPDAVFRVRHGSKLRMDYVSPRMTDLTGLTADELTDLSWSWRQVVPEDDQGVLRTLDVATDRGVTTPPFRIVRPDGDVRWVEARIAPERDPDGRIVALSGIVRDITAHHEVEEALRRTIEHEQQAAEQLRKLAALKDSLLAAVSHELRTPLTAVMGFAEVLRTAGEDLEPLRRDRVLAALERNAQRLERMLVDLLDLDRLDRGVVEPARRAVDLARIVGSVVDQLELQKEFRMSVAVPPRIIHVDPAKIERVVENLLVNAIKHTPPGSQVWVHTRDVDGGVLLSVEDDGPGVPDELKSLVFEPFERGDADSPAPGTGIGLSLVRRFVEIHGGRAWVEDRAEGGSSFNVWLPDAEPTPPGSP